MDHGIGGALTSLKKIGVFPSEIGIDLLVLAAHVHAADTRISRAEQSQDSWTREIRLVVPVSDPARWGAASAHAEEDAGLLDGRSLDDRVQGTSGRFATIAQAAPPSLIAPPFDSLSLFSGGLDSLIGAIDLLEDGATPLLVSHFGEGATSDAQGKLFTGLKKHYDKSSFERLRVGMTFKDGLVEDVGSENSTRGRSFLFFALGVFAGTGLGSAFSLRVPENGLIALNVPLDPLRLGSNSTRTTHPYYMARWNDLLDGLGIDGQRREPVLGQDEGRDGCRLSEPGVAEASWQQTRCRVRHRPRGDGKGDRHRALWLLPAVPDSPCRVGERHGALGAMRPRTPCRTCSPTAGHARIDREAGHGHFSTRSSVLRGNRNSRTS